MADTGKMDRNLALEVVRVTEAAALAASLQMGRGDERMADQVAVDAMRNALNSLDIAGTVVIGEGERDEAPMLFIGEEVGTGDGPKIDIALDPLEGTTITAKGLTNSLAVIAMAEHDGFLNSPDVYMERSPSGADYRKASSISIKSRRKPCESCQGEGRGRRGRRRLYPGSPAPPRAYQESPRCWRPNHADYGRRRFRRNGDFEEASGVDIYLGSGGAPEGV